MKRCRTSCSIEYPMRTNFVQHRQQTGGNRLIHTTRSVSTSSSSPSFLLRIHEEVQQALAEKKPLVALESTIVAHGMPYPQNLDLALDIESILRNEGVTPATIAIQNGVACVGLSPGELQDLALAGKEGRATKCSTRDLPLIMSQGSNTNISDGQSTQWGATTVASTMRLAHLAGISTFVTGGIGGVHRHGETTMDVSADLVELSQTPIIVVSAGIKSILDIERTLEVLETHSVPTFSWQSDDFPAFFSPTSGVRSPARVENAHRVAAAYRISQQLQLDKGILVAVPNQDPANGEVVEAAIQQALQESNKLRIRGKDVTPFILKRVAEMTGGASLKSNMALVRQNALVGAAIAKAVAEMKKD
jgi:pseudouridine-5'-phosphate glycosidase